MALGGMVTGLIAARRRGLFNKVSSLLIGLGGKSHFVGLIFLKKNCTYTSINLH